MKFVLFLTHLKNNNIIPGKTSLTTVPQPGMVPTALLTLVRPNFLLNTPARFSLVLMYKLHNALPTATTSSEGLAPAVLLHLEVQKSINNNVSHK